MISKKYNFIYIHIPKTGGNSIQTVLAPYADDKVVLRRSIGNVLNEDGLQGLDVFNDEIGFSDPKHKHASIQDYYSKLGDEIYSYYIFASIRNPWDRVISQTAFLSMDKLPNRPLTVDEINFPLPMIDYISINGKVVINGFIRFEYLQYDFNNICRSLKIPDAFLPHKNRSIRKEYRGYYCSRTARYVAEKFSADIDLFGYAFENEVVDG